MARGRKSDGSSYMMYALYAVAGYFAYTWFTGQQSAQTPLQIPAATNAVAVPEPTVSAFPRF